MHERYSSDIFNLADIDDVIANGVVGGELLYWKAATKKWTRTEASEIKWDDTNVILIIQGTTQTNRLLAGGVS